MKITRKRLKQIIAEELGGPKGGLKENTISGETGSTIWDMQVVGENVQINIEIVNDPDNPYGGGAEYYFEVPIAQLVELLKS